MSADKDLESGTRKRQQVVTETYSGHVIILVVMSILSSVLLILGNKYLLVTYQFNYVLTLSACHFLFTSIFTRVYGRMGYFEPKRTVPQQVITQMALFGASSIVLMNFNLQTNSVGFYQLTKLMCIPYMVIFNRIVHQNKVSLEMALSLLLILSGVGLSTLSEVELNFVGSVIGVLSVVVTAQFQIWQGSKQKEHMLNPLQITDIIMPTQLMVTSTFAILFEFNPLFIQRPVLDFEWSMQLSYYIVLTCVAAIAVNILTYALIGKTSAVTYQVVGHLKTILTLIGGYYLFPQSMPTNVYGIVIALIGMFLYSNIKGSPMGRSFLCQLTGVEKLWTREI
ncbi:hypothetical protein MP228_005000 [Amoeboaphelidium protococcarum]|nr:hypothetical protein MP228_009795 [Amoeboaphelidium protococcarum]KAI3650146.1 hypothetical protein MP228_005000 [Amoeboaphelidium protococcarum]